jgi:hypothetical protein
MVPKTKAALDTACGNRGGDVVEITARRVPRDAVELRLANPDGAVEIRKHVV